MWARFHRREHVLERGNIIQLSQCRALGVKIGFLMLSPQTRRAALVKSFALSILGCIRFAMQLMCKRAEMPARILAAIDVIPCVM